MSFRCSCGFVCPTKNSQKLIQHMDTCISYPFESDLCQMMERRGIWNLHVDELQILKAELLRELNKVQLFIDEKKNNTQLIQFVQDFCDWCGNDEECNQLENCDHSICNNCLIDLFSKQLEKELKENCCKCGQQINKEFIIQILGINKTIEIENQVIQNNPQFIRCIICKQLFNHEVTENKGLNQNEIICPYCKATQCKLCKSQPYHNDQTCDEYQLYVQQYEL